MVIIVIMALFLSFSQGVYAGSAATKVPDVAFLFHENGRLVFAEKFIDFGRIKRGITVSREIHYKNASESAVTLSMGFVSDLLKVEGLVDGKVVAPGEEGKFTINLDTSRGRGTIVTTAIAQTNEKILSSYVFTVKAQIFDKVLAFPSTLALVPNQNKQLAGAVRVASLDSALPLGALKLEFDQSVLSVGQKAEQDGFVIEATLKPESKLTSYEGSIKVIAGDKGEQTLIIPVMALAENKVILQPTAVDFGTLTATEKKEKEIRVKGVSADKEILLRADLFVNGVQVEQENVASMLKLKRGTSDGKDRVFKVEILHDGTKSGKVHGQFVVLNSEVGWREPTVDFYALFEQKKN